MSLLSVTDGPTPESMMVYNLGRYLGGLVKAGSTPEPAYCLSGMLHVAHNDSGDWGMLSVPNALVRGVYSMMDEPGIELPSDPLNAHISVFRPDEMKMLGGPKRLTERGKRFFYRLGGLVSVEPEGWPDMARVWMLRVHSPELQALRRSYGLSSLPKDGEWDFHISVAVRRRGVLGRNDVSKASEPAA
jgi:hypothetical protein